MNKKVAIVLVNYKDYAQRYLAECFESISQQDYPGEIKIFITDNESTDESLALLKNMAPEAEIIINKNNDGFAKGNNDAIKMALEQGFDYIILFNMDTAPEKDCVIKMAEAAESDEKIGAVQARLMLFEDKEKINSLGNVTHFLGFGYSDGYGEVYRDFGNSSKQICYPSGAGVLFKEDVLRKVGLFDETMWMYNEDQDLGWRIWLFRYQCVLATDAVLYHKYEFSRSIKKYYYMDRNRIVAVLKNYHWATLILILPAFLIMEIGLIFFSIKNGWFFEKMKVYSYFLNLENWRRIMAERKKVQESRTVSDRRIVKMFSGKIWYQEIGGTKLKIANIIFNSYWKIVRFLIKW